MPQQPQQSSVPRGVALADLLFLGLIAVAASVFVPGGGVLRLAGVRLSLTSAWRPLLFAAAVTILRHVAHRRPSLPQRLFRATSTFAVVVLAPLWRSVSAIVASAGSTTARHVAAAAAQLPRDLRTDGPALLHQVATTWPAAIRRSRLLILIAVVLVAARSVVLMGWEQSCFDSDQAVVGLMAKHIAEGRAVPIFYYGQSYMLAVEAWLAAPIFVVFGPSVLALKLPLLLVNVLVAVLLIVLLQTESRLKPGVAFAASLFFIVAAPAAAARLVEVNGGSVEVFLYVLLLWLARAQPILFGAVLGFGFLHREFTAYGALALLTMHAVTGQAFSRRVLVRAAAAGLTAASVWAGVYVLNQHIGTPFGPGSTGLQLGSATNVQNLRSRVCWSPKDLWWRLDDLRNRHLGVLFGTAAHPLSKLGIVSKTTWQGLPGLSLGLLGVLVAVIVRIATLLRRARRVAGEPGTTIGFPVYLLAVSGFSIAVVWALACDTATVATLRYNLLALFAPIGLAGVFFALERSRLWSAGLLFALTFWAVVSACAHAALFAEYLRRPPPNYPRAAVEALVAQGVQSAHSRYAIAYHLAFVSGERVVLSAEDYPRIDLYEKRVAALGEQAKQVRPGLCPGGTYLAGDLYLCPD